MLQLSALLDSAPLGDKRLTNRAYSIVASLLQGQTSATDGTQGVGHASPFSHTMGSFRFFDNDRLKLPALYAPCLRALTEQTAPGQRCYIVHDFSPVDYSQHQAKEDLIQVGNERGYGYDLYTALVLNEQGMPLGPVVQELRTTQGCLSSESEQPLPFVDHLGQSERGIRATQRILPGRSRVHVMDREFDDLQLHRFNREHDERSIIRCQHLDRKVEHRGQPTTLERVVSKLALANAGQVIREGKTYDMFVGETEVVFTGKSYRGVARKRNPATAGSPIRVRVIFTELRMGDKTPFTWVLLTDLEDPIFEIVKIYTWRWRVERFFYLNKVGFRLEQWRQETGDRIVRRLALTQLAAMMIYQAQLAAQSDPELAELIKVVATLGGWLGRKGDPLGPIVLMRGMSLVLGMVRAMEEFGPERLLEIAQQVTTHMGLRRLRHPR